MIVFDALSRLQVRSKKRAAVLASCGLLRVDGRATRGQHFIATISLNTPLEIQELNSVSGQRVYLDVFSRVILR